MTAVALVPIASRSCVSARRACEAASRLRYASTSSGNVIARRFWTVRQRHTPYRRYSVGLAHEIVAHALLEGVVPWSEMSSSLSQMPTPFGLWPVMSARLGLG